MPNLYPFTKPMTHNPMLRPYDLRMLLPLQGLTLLAVEDSRYACDALRLLCQRSGARLRRAENLMIANAHLRCYRPDVVIIDSGLPDGQGEDLIHELTHTRNFPGQMPVVLGTSGDPYARARSMAAGAVGFLEKPFPRLEAFQALILAQLSDMRQKYPVVNEERLEPDTMALLDDLRVAEKILHNSPPAEQREWLAGFLKGVARQSQDYDLADASQCLYGEGMTFTRLADLLRDRIGQVNAFAPPNLS